MGGVEESPQNFVRNRFGQKVRPDVAALMNRAIDGVAFRRRKIAIHPVAPERSGSIRSAGASSPGTATPEQCAMMAWSCRTPSVSDAGPGWRM